MTILSNTLLIFQTIAIWSLLDGLWRILWKFKQPKVIKYSLIEILIGQLLFFGLVIITVTITHSETFVEHLASATNNLSRLALSFDAALGGTLTIFTSNQIDKKLKH